MNLGYLLAAVFFTVMAIRPVFFHDSWVESQREYLDHLFGPGAGRDAGAEDEIEEHRQAMVPIMIVIACVFWAATAYSLHG